MKFALIALSLAALLPLSASAQQRNLSYTYGEAGYVNADGDADGAYVKGSYDFGQSGVYGFGQYGRLEVDNSNFKLKPFELGAGYHYSLSGNTDLLGEAAYARVDTDVGDAEGYRASIGVRSALSPRFDGLAKVNYRDGRDFNGNTTVTLGTEYHITPTWGVVGEAELGDHDARLYNVGVRASF